jgi:arabinogalactan endo-1,4-beta-galactosidase
LFFPILIPQKFFVRQLFSTLLQQQFRIFVTKTALYSAIIFFLMSQLFPQQLFLNGVDISSLPQVEKSGGVFQSDGKSIEPVVYFANSGINCARIRLWNSPADGYNNLASDISLAHRIKNAGMDVLLDFHYSDTWADPSRQTKPAAWAGLDFTSLTDSVYSYTKRVVSTCKSEGCTPKYVQIGNEITCGFLWDDGKVCNSGDSAWEHFSQLLKSAIKGIKDVTTPSDSVKIILHIDRSGDLTGAQWFFDHIAAYNVPFDIIGLSYYPWWHGNLQSLQQTVDTLALKYVKDILIVETAYPWTLAANDTTTNIVGSTNQLLSGYNATPAGQFSFIKDVISIVKNIPNHKGIGVFYWEPVWITTNQSGSVWENNALFDFTGNALPAIGAFSNSLGIQPHTVSKTKLFLYENFPNPFNPSTTITYYVPELSRINMAVYNILGKEVETLVNEVKSPGTYSIDFNAATLPGGVYFYTLRNGSNSLTRKMILLK